VLLAWLVQFVLPLVVGVGLIGGVLWLSDRARDDLRRQGKHVASFTDIECDPPPGLTRVEFLEEAQYLAGLPDRLDLLDTRTPDRVRDALQGHPWVAEVRQVRIRGDKIQAEVEHRKPALWVEWSPRSARAVDAGGVLLPVSATKEGLSILTGPVSRPVVRAGEAWGDPAVEIAAKLVGWLRERPGVVELADCRIEVRGDELTLMVGKRRIIWGRAPGNEKPPEPDAAKKAVRLRAQREGDVDLRK
jgi:hypothetical protein